MDAALILIGGGAHLSVVVEVARLNHRNPAGIVDREQSKIGELLGIDLVGGDDQIERLIAEKFEFHIAITEPAVRRKLREHVQRLGGRLVTLVHPRAIVSDMASIGDGCFLAAGAIVNPNAVLAQGVVVNTGAQIDHDCKIGSDCHIAPGAILAGNVTCGDGTFIASGAVVTPNIRIGLRCVIGAGSTVLDHVQDEARVFGTPARQQS